jgi:RNA polymerase sigma-70 factor (ECF subfamily)
MELRRNVVQGNESEWLIRAQNGDAQAFTNVVETYERPVFNLCFRMLGNAQDAEDAAQETFVRAYQSIRRYDNSRAFSTWILSIAAHYCIDQIRKRRVQVVSVEDLPYPDLPDHSPGMESNLSRREEQQKIRGVLEILDATDRAAVVMYYWYDFSYEEICQALSISMSALKSRLHRARRAMAEEWLRTDTDQSVHENAQNPRPTSRMVERMVL